MFTTFVTLKITIMNVRLQQFLAAENITQAQLADNLNVARAGISHILAGRNKPSYDFLSSLMIKYPRLNIEWMMFGKGKMYKDSDSRPGQVEQVVTNRQDELFPAEITDETLSEIKNSDTVQEFMGNSVESTYSQQSHEVIKVVEKQRNVKKILILFDDGTFQEM